MEKFVQRKGDEIAIVFLHLSAASGRYLRLLHGFLMRAAIISLCNE
jgi:hypothetical protein